MITMSSCKKQGSIGPQPVPTGGKWIVTTIAGDGIRGFADGPASIARFAAPFDVAVAPSGTIYVSDAGNHRIRKIMDGFVSSFAGNGNKGIIDGDGSLAEFKDPYLITLDANENLFSLDINDPRIRKITPAGSVTTYAGTGTPGFTDGPAAQARFQAQDGGLVADRQGNLFVADYNNQRVRKINASGEVSTIAGNGFVGFVNGSGAFAEFHQPSGVAMDSLGNIYVIDALNYRIRKIAINGDVTTYAGNGLPGLTDNPANTARFTSLSDMIIDKKGNLYVTDADRIRKISTDGIVSTIAGGEAGHKDGEGSQARFNSPTGLGIDELGNIYVADTGNNRIRKITPGL
jgi:sugar lactone lactonase YvrE